MRTVFPIIAIALFTALMPPEPTIKTATEFTEVVQTPAPVPEPPQTTTTAPSEFVATEPVTEPASEPPALPAAPELPTEPVREPDTTNQGGRSVELN